MLKEEFPIGLMSFKRLKNIPDKYCEDGIDDIGHGTNVIGLLLGIARDNQINLQSIKVMGRDSQGNIIGNFNTVKKGFLITDGGVINLSLGMDNLILNRRELVKQTKWFDNYIQRTNKVVCFAIGNNGPGIGTISGWGDSKVGITIGSTGIKSSNQIVSEFSSRGPTIEGITKPDVVAIGETVYVSCTDEQWELFPERRGFNEREGKTLVTSGTSISTPSATYSCMLIMDALQKNGVKKISNKLVKSVIMCSTNDLGFSPNIQGAGTIDLGKLIDIIKNGFFFQIENNRFIYPYKTYSNIKIIKLNNKSIKAKFEPLLQLYSYGGKIYKPHSDAILIKIQDIIGNVASPKFIEFFIYCDFDKEIHLFDNEGNLLYFSPPHFCQLHSNQSLLLNKLDIEKILIDFSNNHLGQSEPVYVGYKTGYREPIKNIKYPSEILLKKKEIHDKIKFNGFSEFEIGTNLGFFKIESRDFVYSLPFSFVVPFISYNYDYNETVTLFCGGSLPYGDIVSYRIIGKAGQRIEIEGECENPKNEIELFILHENKVKVKKIHGDAKKMFIKPSKKSQIYLIIHAKKLEKPSDVRIFVT